MAKAASRYEEACRGRDLRALSDKQFKFIIVANDLQEEPKFRHVQGSGARSEGHPAMDAARQLLSMGGASQQLHNTRESSEMRVVRHQRQNTSQ